MMTCPVTYQEFGTAGGWWPCEVRALKSMLTDNYSIVEMAAVLDRQYSAVFVKARNLKRMEQTA